MVHAMKADEGRTLTELRAEAWPGDPQQLQPGEAYVLGVGDSGLVNVRVPLLGSPTRAGAHTRAAATMDIDREAEVQHQLHGRGRLPASAA